MTSCQDDDPACSSVTAVASINDAIRTIALHALRTDTVLPQRFLVRIQARAAAVDRRHRERRGFEGDLLDAGVGHHVHAQARAQDLVFLVRDQVGETVVDVGHGVDTCNELSISSS
jgi:hypothetical protein